MADFSAKLLDLPAVEAASRVALAYLDDAAAAARRLHQGADRVALHDFRVSLRRLRVTIRAYPGLHETVSKKQRRRLRKVARATNAARDAEVQLDWFRRQTHRFSAAQRATLAPLRARLRAERRRELVRAKSMLGGQFAKLERKLRGQLELLQRHAGAHEAPFRALAAATLIQHANEMRAGLSTITPSSDPEELHAARIAAKRLRYLLEPAAAGLAEAARLVDALKAVQDLFGALTDAHELDARLQAEGDAAAPAAKLLQEDVDGLFRTLRGPGAAHGPALQKHVTALANRLRPALKRPLPPRARRRERRATPV
jgi:CHAD domain-containing protein